MKKKHKSLLGLLSLLLLAFLFFPARSEAQVSSGSSRVSYSFAEKSNVSEQHLRLLTEGFPKEIAQADEERFILVYQQQNQSQPPAVSTTESTENPLQTLTSVTTSESGNILPNTGDSQPHLIFMLLGLASLTLLGVFLWKHSRSTSTWLILLLGGVGLLSYQSSSIGADSLDLKSTVVRIVPKGQTMTYVPEAIEGYDYIGYIYPQPSLDGPNPTTSLESTTSQFTTETTGDSEPTTSSATSTTSEESTTSSTASTRSEEPTTSSTASTTSEESTISSTTSTTREESTTSSTTSTTSTTTTVTTTSTTTTTTEEPVAQEQKGKVIVSYYAYKWVNGEVSPPYDDIEIDGYYTAPDYAFPQVAPSDILEGNIGENYNTKPKEIAGFKLANYTYYNESGVFADQTKEVRYYYGTDDGSRLKEGFVKLNFVLEDGSQFALPRYKSGIEGLSYEVEIPELDSYGHL